MTSLSFTDEQLRELSLALRLHLERLEQEISRTEEKDYREDLVRSFEILSDLERKLKTQLEGTSVYA